MSQSDGLPEFWRPNTRLCGRIYPADIRTVWAGNGTAACFFFPGYVPPNTTTTSTTPSAGDKAKSGKPTAEDRYKTALEEIRDCGAGVFVSQLKAIAAKALDS